MTRRCFRALCVANFLVLTSVVGAQSPETVSVCNLFDNLVKWDGQMVEVGAYIQTQPPPGRPENGIWVSGRECPSRIVVKGISFPNTINLSDPQNRVTRIHAVTFEWDETSRSALAGLLARIDPTREHILATIVGLFETRTPLDDLVVVNRAHPEGNRLGFGPQGPHPAQILVKTIRNMRIEKM